MPFLVRMQPGLPGEYLTASGGIITGITLEMEMVQRS